MGVEVGRNGKWPALKVGRGNESGQMSLELIQTTFNMTEREEKSACVLFVCMSVQNTEDEGPGSHGQLLL